MEWDRYTNNDQRAAAKPRALAKLKQELGRELQPIDVKSKAIAKSFWGKAWCKNLENYADYDYRLERGRSYLRSGAILDLTIEPGIVRAFVLGGELYQIEIIFKPCSSERWQKLQAACADEVSSLLDLLSGQLSEAVMAALINPDYGLFPKARGMVLSCTCLDVARVCKHLAAVLYGIGARLDEAPELLFTLRDADMHGLVVEKTTSILANKDGLDSAEASALGELFGIDLSSKP